MPYVRTKLFYILLWVYTAMTALLFHTRAHAQTTKDNTATDNSIFYEVKGNGLSAPSYLFGTFHLLTESFVKDKPGITQRFNACKQMVGEMVIDSTLSLKMASAIMLDGTTLDKVLDKKLYDKTNKWLKELSGYDLAILNNYNPMAINVMLLQFMQSKYFPNGKGEQPMDLYFQQEAGRKDMKVMGFESMEDQVNALFKQLPEKRQVELLQDFVNKKEKNVDEMKDMIKMYTTQNLSGLEKLMYDKSYTDDEVKVMLTDRNNHWITELPALMKDAPTFVAVGALHLAGPNGLVQQLRKLGYTVTPVSLRS